jgi:hypothetical protein
MKLASADDAPGAHYTTSRSTLRKIVRELRLRSTAELEELLAQNIEEFAAFQSRGGRGDSIECAQSNVMFVLYQDVLAMRRKNESTTAPIPMPAEAAVQATESRRRHRRETQSVLAPAHATSATRYARRAAS